MDKDELLRLIWPDTVVEEANLSQNVFVLRKTLGETPSQIRYVATVPRRGYQFVADVRETALAAETRPATAREAGTPRSLAVMPFTFLGPEGTDDYLGLGLADALITRLGNIRQIAIRPTGSVRRYAGSAWDPAAAGRELGVEAVLEGYIQRSGERVRVTVQMVDVRTGSPLWGERLDETFADMFAVQDAIAERVADSLLVRLSRDERSRLRRPYTADSEAYHAYLRGRFHWHKRNREGLERALGHFQQAIERDPAYALAYTGLADTDLFLSGIFGATRLRDAVARARAAAARALAIDDELAEAHASLALAELFDWNWSAAEREFLRCLELNPSYASAHNWYACLLTGLGRLEEGMVAAERALHADPLSLVASMGVGHFRYFARQFERAIEQERRTLEMDSSFYQAHWVLGLSYEQIGRHEDAVAALEKASVHSGGSPVMLALLGRAFGLAGRADAAHDGLARLSEVVPGRHVSPECLALVHDGLGEADLALAHLERACDERAFWLPFYLKAAPLYDRLRSHPRFAAVLRRMGLTP
jgi:TolB-like protein